MEIKIDGFDCPDSTYFRTEDAAPEIKDGVLYLVNGTGSRRSSWGAPSVTSTVVVNDDTLTAIHVGFHHKHGGGQFWRYYVSGERRTWVRLTVDQQTHVLAAYQAHTAPAWAKVPGVLSTERKSGILATRTGYKLVGRRADGTLYSLYDPTVVYALGKRRADKAAPDHQGGLYAYPDLDGMLRLWLAGRLLPQTAIEGNDDQIVAVEVQAAGTFVDYDNGKFAATYLTPVAVVMEVAHASR